MNFFTKILSCLTKKVPLKTGLTEERDFIFCLAKTPYDDEVDGHFSVLSTIYSHITGEKSCASSGPHWKDIGFQSDLPSRDIRGSGMLGPFAALHLVESYPQFTQAMVQHSLNPETNFPFIVSIFEKVLLGMKLVRQSTLNSVANSSDSFVQFFMELCEALNFLFFAIYEKGSYNIRNYGSVKANFESKIEKKIVAVLKEFQNFSGGDFEDLKTKLLSLYN